MATLSSKSNILLISRPRQTEKASFLTGTRVYTFEVAMKANKKEIASAVQEIYGVRPVKIRTVKLPEKTFWYRKGFGKKTGVKKAMVTLKEGDKIEFI